MVDWRCNFIQSIDSHESKKKQSESSTTRGAQEEDRSAEAIDCYRNTKTTAEELLQPKSTSSSNTRIEALILGRGLKYILKKGLA